MGAPLRFGAPTARADQYMVSAHDEPFLSQVWFEPHEALLRLRHDSHAWAVAAWLRARAR